MRLGGGHLLALVAIALGALALNATEFYTSRYQTLPALDWLESRPPLVESANVPAAGELVRGLPQAMPLLVITEDRRPLLVRLGPPGQIQRTIGGVRDASRLLLGSPLAEEPPQIPPVQARLDVVVFDRVLRAAAWSDLLASALDVRDPENGLFQVRVSGPDATDRVWLVSPQERSGGIATIVGHRGPVGFELQVTCQRPGPQTASDIVELSARAERIAEAGVAAWTAWLQPQLQAAGASTAA